MRPPLFRPDPSQTIIVAAFFFFAGVNGARPLVPLYGASLGVGAGELGVLVAVYALLPLLFTSRFGSWLDTHGNLPAILLALGVTVVGLLFPVLLPGRVGLYLSQAVVGSGFTAFILAGQKFVGQSAPDLWARERGIARFTISIALGGLVGPLLGGLVVDWLGYPEAFGLMSVFALGAVAVVLPLLFSPAAVQARAAEGARRRAPPMAPTPPQGRVARYLRVFSYNPYMGRAFMVSVLILMGRDMYIAYFPFYATAAGLSASVIGALIAAQNGGAVLVRVFLLPLVRLVGKNRVVVWSIALGGVLFLTIPLFEGVWALALVSVLIGSALGIGQPLAITTTMNLSPADKVGEVLGFRLMLNRLTQVFGPLGFAATATLTGVSGVFLVVGVLMLAGSTRLSIPADAEAQAGIRRGGGMPPPAPPDAD